MAFANMNKQDLENTYLGKRIHVIIEDRYHPIDAYGKVEKVDDAGQLHGTWGGLAAIPGVDYISLTD